MSLQYIRDTYQVPAKRGQEVIYTNSDGRKIHGKIIGSKGQYLKVKFTEYGNNETPKIHHPTFNLEYVK